MKKINITVSFDEEKLGALRLFLSQKSLDLDKEIAAHVEKLYARVVPQNVRNYLELRDCAEPVKPPKKAAESPKTQGYPTVEKLAG